MWLLGLLFLAGVGSLVMGLRTGNPGLVKSATWLLAPVGAFLAFVVLVALFTGGRRGRRKRAGGSAWKSGPTYLAVPFAEKDAAKALGARWNPEVKSWFVPEHMSTAPFSRWLPTDVSEGAVVPPRASAVAVTSAPGRSDDHDDDDGGVLGRDSCTGKATLESPIFIAESETNCWRCRRQTPVIAVAASRVITEGMERIEELTLISNLISIPRDLANVMAGRWPNYKPAYSKTGGGRYVMNHCAHCGAKLGDHFLHDEPGGAFLPMRSEDARHIVLHSLPLRGTLDVVGAAGIVSPNLIQRHAQRRNGIVAVEGSSGRMPPGT